MAQPAEKRIYSRASMLPQGFEGLSAKEQRNIIKREQAKRYSDLIRVRNEVRKYSTTMRDLQTAGHRESLAEAKKQYLEVRKEYLYFVYYVQGYDAYKRSEKIENQILANGVSGTVLKEYMMLAAVPIGITGIAVTGGIPGLLYMLGGIGVGMGVRYLVPSVGKKAEQSFTSAQQSSLSANETPEEFESKNASVVSKRMSSKKTWGWIRFLSSIGAGVGAAVAIGMSVGQLIEKASQDVIDKYLSQYIGADAAHALAHGTGHFDMAIAYMRSMGHAFAGVVRQAVVGLSEVKFNSILGVSAAMAAEPVVTGARGGSSALQIPEGSTPKDVVLGHDPYAPTPEAGIDNTVVGPDGKTALTRWIDLLAQKEHWSAEEKAAVLKWFSEPANRTAYLAAMHQKEPGGMLVEVHGQDRVVGSMVNGPTDGYGVDGPSRLPDGTRVVRIEIPWTDANGVKHIKVIESPVACNNFSGGPDTVLPVEVAPKPKTPLGEFWGQLMCPDSTLAQYYLGFTITDFGDFDPTNWKASLHDTFMKYILPTIPAEYKPDYVLARIDLNHDGVPDQLVKIYIKDSFDVDASGNKVPVHAGDIRDWVVHPDKGPAINVSELPPDQRDAFLEANEKKNTIGYDPVATQEANNGHKGGPAQSTPNPVDRWVLGSDGKLHPAFQTPAELADEYFRIFINGIFHTDNLPIELEKLLWPILDSQASEIKSMSVSEIVTKFHLSEEQAQELLAYIKGFGERAHLKPNAGETLQDYMKRCFTVVAEKSQK